MSFQLVIAEKPSVALSIAAVIGAAEKQNGYWQGGGYLVSWCIGHLVSFAEAGQYDEKYCKWRYEDEKQKQDLEYRMLQNQINPHFIYNTLNSIKWMATIQHAPGIAEMVMALSRLLKSISKSNERLVPLYEEFALLNDYFTIQQYRYGGTITLDVSYIEDESLNHSCLIPRFTLQPLVENAIFHGIEPKGSAGEVTLRVERDTANGDVLIHLTDDGKYLSIDIKCCRNIRVAQNRLYRLRVCICSD